MKSKTKNLQKGLYLIAAIILLVGLSSAVLIYLTAEDASNGVLGYEVIGGNVYPIRPEDSKTYTHDLELYGGKANVLVNELMRWFDGLWHGRSLAFTVGFVTILISFVLFLVARHLSSGPESGLRHE